MGFWAVSTPCLRTSNSSLSCGKHVAMDATLIQSARRAKKTITTYKNNETYDVYTDLICYSDNQEAKWTYKEGKVTYG
jgi:hypothetical protein